MFLLRDQTSGPAAGGQAVSWNRPVPLGQRWWCTARARVPSSSALAQNAPVFEIFRDTGMQLWVATLLSISPGTLPNQGEAGPLIFEPGDVPTFFAGGGHSWTAGGELVTITLLGVVLEDGDEIPAPAEPTPPAVVVSGLSTVFVEGIHGSGSDAIPPGSVVNVFAEQALYNPAGNVFERARTPTTFKTVTTAGGGTVALWAPAAGKRFRLMGAVFTIINASAAAPANGIAKFVDSATDVGLSFDYGVAGAAVVSNQVIPLALPGNGYLSAVADNVLNLNTSAALTAGAIRVAVWGTEE